jgi:hypothetical protein
MKHIKEYEESEIGDLVSDLRSVGQSEWAGYFITYKVGGDNELDSSAIAIVGDSLKSIALQIFSLFGMGDTEEELEELEILNVGDLKSIEEIFDEVDNFHSSDMGSSWSNLDYNYVEMTPKVLVNSSDVESLLDFGKAMMMGRNTFTDFESKILQLK